MTIMQKIGAREFVFFVLAAAISTTGFGQAGHTSDTVGGPLTGPPVLNAPFVADATTTLTQTLGDGTRRQQSTMARYYRDSGGRVRVEQISQGVDPLNQETERTTFITLDTDPGHGPVYIIDQRARTVRHGMRGIAGQTFNGGSTFAIPVGTPQYRFRVYMASAGNDGPEEALGSRQIEGIHATGRRFTRAVPVGQFGNDRPLEIVDERWESPELQVVIYARTSDPLTGVLEYRLTNISRAEPATDLFVVPPDYPIDYCSADHPCLTWEPLPQANRAQRGRGRIIE